MSNVRDRGVIDITLEEDGRCFCFRPEKRASGDQYEIQFLIRRD